MRINNIVSLGVYKNNNYKKQNTVTSPVPHSVVSFGTAQEDQKTAGNYFRRFSKTVALENNAKGDEFEKQLNDFFADLNKESASVRKKFLLIRNGEQESAFAQSMYTNCIEASREIIKLYKKADEKTKADFLMPSASGMGSPFFTAVDYDSTHEIADELRKLVKTLSKENQGKFYYYKLQGAFNDNNTLINELRDSGCYQFVKKLEEDKEKFDKENPSLAEKYQKLYPQEDNKIPFKTLKDEADKKTEKTAPSKFRVYEKVKTRFSDVGGMFNVKRQIQNELLNILTNPRVKNADKPSGILLYGPPGTGKTLLATAIAGESGMPFISTAGSSFNEIYVGAGAKNVRELYETARETARNHPSKTAIVFIDEADAVAGKRDSSSGNKENNHTLNALLSELDGVQSKEESDIKIITIFATNRKDMFDDAFRKGRIDLEFKIDDPRFSEKARREILEIKAKGKPFKDEISKEKILTELAQSSQGMSGAELADVIKRAYRKTLYKTRKITYITEKDVNEAKLEALIGIKNDSEKSDYEQKSVLAHEAGHAINQIIMNRIFANEQDKSKMPRQKLDFIVNESRGDAAGLTMMKPSQDNHRLTVESLLSGLVVNYGGYSIEEQLFDGHTDGVSGDLENSTNLILNSVTKWGLGSKTKFISCSPDGISFELFKSDIKQDIIDYSEKAMGISTEISAFTKPFIEEYIETFSKADSNKASIITGERFEKMFDQWLKRNGNQKDFQRLCTDIRDSIDNFKKKIKS